MLLSELLLEDQQLLEQVMDCRLQDLQLEEYQKVQQLQVYSLHQEQFKQGEFLQLLNQQVLQLFYQILEQFQLQAVLEQVQAWVTSLQRKLSIIITKERNKKRKKNKKYKKNPIIQKSNNNNKNNKKSSKVPNPNYEQNIRLQKYIILKQIIRLYIHDQALIQRLSIQLNYLITLEGLYKDMEKPKRQRLLSSLYDLKLRKSCSILSVNSQQQSLCVSEESSRKQRRQTSIKASKDNQNIAENFIDIEKNKTFIDKALIFESLKNHFIFNALLEDENIVENFIQNFKLCSVGKGWYLMSQNDEANFFFILHQGVLSVQVNEQQKCKIYSGSGFGELALLYSAPRSASIKALKDSTLWYIDRKTFQRFVKDIMERKFQQNLQFIQNIHIFKSLTVKQKSKLASLVITQKFEPNQKVFQSGSRASSMFVVKSGKLKKSVRGYSFQVLKKGDACEEFAVLTKNFNHRQTLIAIQKSELLSFGAEHIQKALGKSLPTVVCRNIARQKMLKISSFNCLSIQFMNKIIDTFQIRKIQRHQVVIYPGLLMKNLIFFIIEGNLKVSNNKISEIYGCQSLEKERRQLTYDFYLNFQSEGRIAYTSLEEIQRNLQCSFRDLQQKNNLLFVTMQKHKKAVIQQRYLLRNCSRDTFVFMNKIGQGHFGQVYKVRCKQNYKLYALKIIQRSETKLKYLQNQQTILERVISPFVVDYYGYYQDQQKIYFILEYIQGIQLFTALRSLGLLTVKQSKFYTAILFEAIHSMHKINVIYRDLKPENIMLQKRGYLKIIDMGTCKVLESTQRTFTIIGTPCYMAPQVLLGKGYSFENDLWSLGVILYQFLAGKLPFGEQLEDPYQIFQQVLNGDLNFPSYMIDEDAIDLIQRLLNRKPYERLLGCYSTIRNHPFFDGIQWQQLLNKLIEPFYNVPNNTNNNNKNEQQQSFSIKLNIDQNLKQEIALTLTANDFIRVKIQ